MKVDLVYTWVDNNDPRWCGEKAFWSKISEDQDKEANNNCRFCDNEELRYSLRSANKNAPWINHIFIITDKQVPSWLDINHPKITIVDHSEIMPSEFLPTYHSVAIEMALDKVPNLSEHFLYANDDMFFLNSVDEDFFFDHNQNPYIRLCRVDLTDEDRKKYTYYNKVANTFELYNKKFKLPEFFKNYIIGHQITPYRKSYLSECKQCFEEKIRETMKMKFRSRNSIQRIIYDYYMADQKRCVVREIPNPKETFKFRQPEFVNVALEYFEWFVKRSYISNGYPKLLCVNDNESADDASREKVKPLLEYLFPIKAEWEILE